MGNMHDDGGQLQRAVDRQFVPVYAENYAQVKDALQDKYGQRGWIGAMAQALSGSDAKSGKPYLAARRSIERYEKGQFKEMKKRSPEMTRVGSSLPPIGKKLPGNQLTITVKANQGDGKGGTRDRAWTVTFSGANAYAFGNNPTYLDFFRAQNYPYDVIDRFEGEEGEGDYTLDVYSVG